MLLTGVCYAQPDATALFRQSIGNFERGLQDDAEWRYVQTDTTRTGSGEHVVVSDVIPIFGTPYDKVIARDGRPLAADEKEKEEAKLDKAVRERESESPAQRAARIRKYRDTWSFLKDLPFACEVSLVGQDTVNGRPAWVLKLAPRPGFVPTTPHGAMLRHIAGSLWIDKEETQWAKAQAHVIDTISIGWVLARIGPGADIGIEFRRIVPNAWMISKIDISGSAKIMMVYRKPLDEELTFTNFRRQTPERPPVITESGKRRRRAGSSSWR